MSHSEPRMVAPQVSPHTTRGTIGRTFLKFRPLATGRGPLVDAAFSLALIALALWGFHDTFSDSSFLIVGLVGALLGVGIAHLTHAIQAPVIVTVALTVIAYFLIGPILGLGRPPGPGAVRELAEVSVVGWKDLLTTLPPVDGDGPLRVLPFLLALFVAVLALTLANRSRIPWLPLVPLVVLLGVVILVGLTRPTSLFLQGCVFGIGCLLWLIVRGRRHVAVVRTGGGQLVRWGAAAAILAIAAGVAVPLGDGVLAGDQKRVVLRDRIIPPFDVGQYPSPLAGFRRFRPASSARTEPNRVHDKELFSVEGAPEGTPVRIATLDAYDGSVWGAANQGGSPGEIDDTFQKVASNIRNPLAQLGGEERHTMITLGEGWSGVWLPTIGAVTHIDFLDDEEGHQAGTFRYNLATSTAVVPAGVGPGDVYELTGVVLDQHLEPGMGASAAVTVDGSFLSTQANDWSEAETDPMPKVLALAKYLKDNGGYTDGKAPFQRYGPGHFRGRMLTFLAGDQIAGNDEQFASALALMANAVGVPARVVLGAHLPEDGVVRGEDVHAWVEVRVADDTWHTIPTEDFLPTKKPLENPPRPQTDYTGAVVPPPAPIPPPSSVGDPADGEFDEDVKRRVKKPEDEDAAMSVPGWLSTALRWVGPPLGLLALFAAVVLALKARRRHRRRNAPTLPARFSGGWAEVVDRARDLRFAFPVVPQTRLEQAGVIGAPRAAELAVVANTSVFDAAEPTEADVEHYWQRVDELRTDLGSTLSPARRILAALSLRSLRRNSA